jgi:uridine kinase
VRIQRYRDLARRVLACPARLGTVRLVTVDGPAGSGKTTFAGRLADALGAEGARVEIVHTDDLLDGWADMVAFWPRLEAWILDPLRHGKDAAYRVYDWHAARFGADWRALPVPDVLIVEGVTSARRESRAERSLAVFVTADPKLRLERGIARDGEALLPRWLDWMAGEERHFAADRTAEVADVVVDGAPEIAHDPAVEYVVAARG